MMVLSDSSTLRLASSMAWPSAEHTSSGYSRFTSGTELLCRLSLRTSMVRTKYCTWNLSNQHSGSVPRSAVECLPIIRIIGRSSRNALRGPTDHGPPDPGDRCVESRRERVGVGRGAVPSQLVDVVEELDLGPER